MGNELTRQYSLPSEEKGIKNPIRFIKDIYQSGKSRELTSFVIWELMHRFGLYPKNKYINLENNAPLALDGKNLTSPDFKEDIVQIFKNSGLKINRSDHNWKVLFTMENDLFGCMYPNDKDLYKSTDNGKSVTLLYSFPETIKSIFVSSQKSLFVCVKGAVYKSSNNSVSFKKVLDLGSHISFFRHNNGMTETPDKTLIIAEYGNIWENNTWRKLAFLYFSFDYGDTWERSDFLIEKGTNKHVHLVKYSHILDKIFMADGDNKKKLWISDPIISSDREPKWNLINKFHIQMGGYTSIVEHGDKVVFGTDYQGGTNFLVETKDGKQFDKRIMPDPYRRSPIINMVQRKSNSGIEIWAYLPHSTSKTKCLLMYTKNGGESWIKLIEYNKASHKIWLANSSNEPTEDLYFYIEDRKNKERIVYKINDL
jgi:hypothetical protein